MIQLTHPQIQSKLPKQIYLTFFPISNRTRCPCVIATAIASVISSGFISLVIPKICFTINATCSLAALAFPVNDFFTCNAVYSEN